MNRRPAPGRPSARCTGRWSAHAPTAAAPTKAAATNWRRSAASRAPQRPRAPERVHEHEAAEERPDEHVPPEQRHPAEPAVEAVRPRAAAPEHGEDERRAPRGRSPSGRPTESAPRCAATRAAASRRAPARARRRRPRARRTPRRCAASPRTTSPVRFPGPARRAAPGSSRCRAASRSERFYVRTSCTHAAARVWKTAHRADRAARYGSPPERLCASPSSRIRPLRAAEPPGRARRLERRAP